MLHVLAYITTKPGMRETVLREFRANMPAVHAEEGCIEYVPVVDLPAFAPSQTELGPDTFVVVEKWASPESLKAHAAAPHMQTYRPKVKNFVKSVELRVLSPA